MIRAIAIAVLSAATLIDGPATVTGRVVVDETGEPIVNARVRITAAAGGSPFTITDADGRFAIAARAGVLRVAAVKSGFVRREMEVRNASNPIELRLTRAAVVVGRVVDRSGEPIVRGVVVVRHPSSTGERTSPIARTETNDRGEFRLAGLAPEPVVVALLTTSAVVELQALPNGQTFFSPRQATVYFPQSESADKADVIKLAPGEERQGIDFVVGADQLGFEDARFAGPMTQRAAPTSGATGSIRGRVTALDGRALIGANVRLLVRPSPIPLRSARTNAEGRFAFTEIPAGTFEVVATKAGYEAAKPNDAVVPPLAAFAAGRSVDVHDGETINRVDIELRRMATVSGLLYDDRGDPVQGANVQLLKVRYERGHRRLVAAGAATASDDRGAYRIFDVRSGQFVVTAAVGGVAAADLPGYARTYFPGSIDPRSAQFVSVGPSQDVVGIDFGLEAARTARVAGTMLGADGAPTMAGRLELRPNGSAGEIAAQPVGASIKPDGSFEFPNVPPGAYLIYAEKSRSQPSIEGDFSATPVNVNGDDVTGLTIQAPPGSTIAGRITFETIDRDHLPPFRSVLVSPLPVDRDLAPGNIADPEVHDDGTFVMQGITGTRRIVPTRLPEGWALREVRVNGIDVTDRPLTFGGREQSLNDVEVLLTDRVGEISGTLLDGDGRVVSGSFVVAMAMDRELRYPESRLLRRAAPDASGAFRIASLSAGAYYVVGVRAVPIDGEDAWQDATFLDSMTPAAISVTVHDGEAQRIALRVPSR